MIPVAALFVTGLLALFAAFMKKSELVIGIVVAGIAATIGLLIKEWNNPYVNNNYRGLEFDHFSIPFGIIMLTITLLVCLVAYGRYKHRLDHVGDYYALLIFSACGGLCLFAFTDLFMLFLGIEILSIPLYVLAGSKKNDLRSNEAALKYFLMGAFATGILLFGIALIYGSTQSFDLKTIASNYSQNPVMFSVGAIMVLCAFCFKVGVAPFHFWSPDVYTGSPTIITSYMATAVKIGAFGAFMKLFYSSLMPAAPYWVPTLAVLAGVTMTIGNITAVFQDNFKRMLAFSSVSHVGYIIMAIIAVHAPIGTSIFNLLFYLTSYACATLLIFTVYMRVKDDAAHEGVSAFNGLGKTQPLMAFAVILGIVSLAGIPPTAGFFGKYFLFANIFNDYPWLVIVAIINSTISIYYYFKVVMAMYFTEPDGSAAPVKCLPVINTVVVVICSLGVISLGILSGFVNIFQ